MIGKTWDIPPQWIEYDLPPLSSLTWLAGKCPNFHPFSIAGWSQPPPCCSFPRENGHPNSSFAHHDLHSPVVFGRGTTFYKSSIKKPFQVEIQVEICGPTWPWWYFWVILKYCISPWLQKRPPISVHWMSQVRDSPWKFLQDLVWSEYPHQVASAYALDLLEKMCLENGVFSWWWFPMVEFENHQTKNKSIYTVAILDALIYPPKKKPVGNVSVQIPKILTPKSSKGFSRIIPKKTGSHPTSKVICRFMKSCN